MKKQRKRCTPEEKVAILGRHLRENEPISKLSDELGLQPTVFYRWQKEFFENGAAARPGDASGIRSILLAYTIVNLNQLLLPQWGYVSGRLGW